MGVSGAQTVELGRSEGLRDTVVLVGSFGERFGYTNCYIIAGRDGHAIVVDPGVGAGPWVIDEVGARGWSAQAVLLTHGHMDHTWDAQPLADFLDVPVVLHEAGRPLLLEPEAGLPRDFPSQLLAGHPRRPPQQLRSATGSMTFGDTLHVDVLPTPGHTPCSVAYLVTAGDDRLVLTGDVVLGGGRLGRAIEPGGDRVTLEASAAVLRPHLSDALVLPGHGDPFSVRGSRAER